MPLCQGIRVGLVPSLFSFFFSVLSPPGAVHLEMSSLHLPGGSVCWVFLCLQTPALSIAAAVGCLGKLLLAPEGFSHSPEEPQHP